MAKTNTNVTHHNPVLRPINQVLKDLAESKKATVTDKISVIGKQGVLSSEDLAPVLEGVTASEVIESIGKAAAMERGSCISLGYMFNAQMPDIDWFNCVYREISEENKTWEPVRKETVKQLKEARHSNPAQFIKRVKDYGRALRYGEINDQVTTTSDGKKNKDIFTRLTDDLVVLYKALNNPSNDEAIRNHAQFEGIASANVKITQALKDDLGVDLESLSGKK